MAEWNPRANEIFVQAIQLEDIAKRMQFVEEACGTDAALREAVETLLKAHDQAGEFLNQPAAGLTADEAAPQATASYTASEAPGTLIAGKYKLLQQIGEGGMGSVWMADQTEPVKRRVAVKLIRTDRGSTKTILARFEAERQAIALMDHPNIAKLLDAGTTENSSPYFVMELVKGVPLTEFCDAHKLSIPDRLSLFMQICSAVQHAHQKGIIHRDLKPSNILVELHDDKPVPKVIDFGLAKATSGIQLTENTLFTGFGTVAGTPLYMAPEQANFNAVDIDTRADVYALGVILYELLTGTTPITRETLKQAALDEMMKLIREQEAPTPSSRLSSSESTPTVAANRHTEPSRLSRMLKGELDWIVMKALEKDRTRRYETANGFARDIERFLNQEPVSAGPVSAGYRFRKFVKRNKGKVVAVGLVILTLVAGIVGTTWGLLEAQKQRDQNDLEKQAALHEKEEKEKALKQAILATEAEREAKKLAEQRLIQVEKGNEILGSIFKNLNPLEEQQKNTSLRMILANRLDSAVKQLDAGAIGDPLTVAKLQFTLGESLLNLQEPSKSRKLLENVVKTRTRLLNDNHEETLLAKLYLARAIQDTGQHVEAIDIFKQILQLTINKFGPNDLRTQVTRWYLAEAYLAVGEHEKAKPLAQESLEFVEKQHGKDGIETLAYRGSLVKIYRILGNSEQAIRLLQHNLSIEEKNTGSSPDSPIQSMNTLASIYLDLDKNREAVDLLNQCLNKSIALYGKESLETNAIRINLAMALKGMGELNHSIEMLKQALTIAETKKGVNHLDTLTCRHNLAIAYSEKGLISRSIPLLESVYVERQKQLSIKHLHTLSTLLTLANDYVKSGNSDKAIPLLQNSLHVLEEKYGVHHEYTLRAQTTLADAYCNQGQPHRAIEILRKVIETKEPNQNQSGSSTLLQARNSLGIAYETAGLRNEAITQFRLAYLAYVEIFGEDHIYTTASRKNLITIYVKAGKFAEALKLQEKTEQILRKAKPIQSVSLAESNGYRGFILLQLKDWAEADNALTTCVSLYEKQPDHWSKYYMQTLLGHAKLEQKKYLEAEKLIVSGYEGMSQRVSMIPGNNRQNHLTYALDRLIQLNTETNKPEEVKKWQAEKEKLLKPEPTKK